MELISRRIIRRCENMEIAFIIYALSGEKRRRKW